MTRTIAVAVLALGAATLLGACGDGDTPGTAATAPGTSTAAGTTSPTSAATGTGTVRAACPLLSADEVIQVLGGSNGTTLTATEKPADTSAGQPEYTCAYGRGGTDAIVLKVLVSPGKGGAADPVIGAIGQASKVRTESVPGLGEASVTYVDGAARILATATTHDRELRTVIISAPAIVPKDKFVELANLVLARI